MSSAAGPDEGYSPTVVGLPIGTWYADSGEGVAAGLGLAAAVDYTFTCWGQMRRALNATLLQEMICARLQQGKVLYNEGEGETGRAAVQLTFPEGIPRRRDLPLSAPQLVIGVAVRLAARLRKDDSLLLVLRTHAEIISRSLGEATGVDSVTCSLATRPEEAAHWRAAAKQPGGAELMQQGEQRYVVYQRGVEVDPHAAAKNNWLPGQ